jgi:transcriptional regulator with XRE-family HTH domain
MRKNIVGDNIRRLRVKAGFTQEELALESGLSQGYINQLESGKRRYTQKSLELISNTLSIPVIELFREEKLPGGVAEEIDKLKRYKKKPFPKEKFLALLDELPEHIVEHYFILLKLEQRLWKKKMVNLTNSFSVEKTGDIS